MTFKVESIMQIMALKINNLTDLEKRNILKEKIRLIFDVEIRKKS